MRTCPVCDANGVGFAALFAAAFRSTGRCATCGYAVKFNWICDALCTFAIMAAFFVGLALQSLTAGVVAGVVVWAAVLLAPLKIDDSDPFTFGNRFRESLKEHRKTTNND